MNKIERYVAKSRGSFPKVGVKGVESAWMPVPQIALWCENDIWVGDPSNPDAKAYFVVDAARGNYEIALKGMDFAGHRRISRVRFMHLLPQANRASRPVPGVKRIGRAIGETFTDSGLIGACDTGALREACSKRHRKSYFKCLDQATEDAIGRLKFDDFSMLTFQGGLGDGTFKVFPVLVGRKRIGIEIEFLPPGFVLKTKIPGIKSR